MAAQPKASVEEVLEAGRALQAEGIPVTGARLRGRLGCGRPDRLAEIWEQAASEQAAEPLREVLPERLVGARDHAVAALAELVSQAVTKAYSDAWSGAEQVSNGRNRADIRAAQAIEANLRAELAGVNEALEVADGINHARVAEAAALEAERAVDRERADASEARERELMSRLSELETAKQAWSLAEARLLACQEDVARWCECHERSAAELVRVSMQAAVDRERAGAAVASERQRADRAEAENADLQAQIAGLNSRLAQMTAAKSARPRRVPNRSAAHDPGA